MKPNLYKFLVYFICLSCNTYQNQLTDFDGYKKTIYRRFPEFEVADKDNYVKECLEEERKKIRFPLEKTEYAIVYKDSLFYPTKKLNNESLSKILLVLNDSSSFIWGEIGTPYFDRHIAFFDKHDSCIGLTHVSYDGQTYSDPQPKKMKWGMLTERALDILKAVLNN